MSNGDYEEPDYDEPEEEGTDEEQAKKKAGYACNICKAMFGKPGMCPNCDVVLKKRAE